MSARFLVQVKKEVSELERGFGTGPQVRLPGKLAAMVRDINGVEAEMATIMIFGDAPKVQLAKSMLLEAVENKEQKQKQRQKVRMAWCFQVACHHEQGPAAQVEPLEELS
jgi:hypothetical protein